MADIKKALEKRRILKAKKPSFRRDGFGKRKRITSEWRKPKGRHSKQRHGMAGHGSKVKPGFRTQTIVRGLHRTGLQQIVVQSLADVSQLTKGTHGAIVGGNVGNRKRLALLAELQKKGIAVLNLKDTHTKKIEEAFKLRKALRAEHIVAKSTKAPKKESKKAESPEVSAEEKAKQEKKEKDDILTKGQK